MSFLKVQGSYAPLDFPYIFSLFKTVFLAEMAYNTIHRIPLDNIDKSNAYQKKKKKIYSTDGLLIKWNITDKLLSFLCLRLIIYKMRQCTGRKCQLSSLALVPLASE